MNVLEVVFRPFRFWKFIGYRVFDCGIGGLQRAMVEFLLQEGQEHLFQHWQAGQNENSKMKFLNQVISTVSVSLGFPSSLFDVW